MAVTKTSNDPQHSAEVINLVYVTDEQPGITRVKKGTGFAYYGPARETINDRRTKKRIQKLVIPPAWENVWICVDERGHLQATGRDTRMRKQYRYHHKWAEFRNLTKFERQLLFAEHLGAIRDKVAADLRKTANQGLSKERVLAALVELLQETAIRIGNPEYAHTNHSYGLTTLKDKHVAVHGGKAQFEFRGKKGVEQSITLANPRLAKIIKHCQEIPGQQLFQYYDAEGQRHPIYSEDVNAYLREITGEDFTAKDFRTWAGTAIAVRELQVLPSDPDIISGKKKLYPQAVKRVAAELGNTPSVCRKYYIHPALEKISNSKDLQRILKLAGTVKVEEARLRGLTDAERVVYKLIKLYTEGAV